MMDSAMTTTEAPGMFVSRVPISVHDLPRLVLDMLDAQAKRRRQTPEAFVGAVLSILAADPVLLANVLDDECSSVQPE